MFFSFQTAAQGTERTEGNVTHSRSIAIISLIDKVNLVTHDILFAYDSNYCMHYKNPEHLAPEGSMSMSTNRSRNLGVI